MPLLWHKLALVNAPASHDRIVIEEQEFLLENHLFIVAWRLEAIAELLQTCCWVSDLSASVGKFLGARS